MGKSIKKEVIVIEKNLTPSDVAHRILCNLMAIYEETIRFKLFEENDFNKFRKAKFDEMDQDPLIDEIKILVDYNKKIVEAKDIKKIDLERTKSAIILSIFYCHKVFFFELDDRDKAWYFASKASEWLGSALGCEHTFRERGKASKNLAEKGGNGKSALFDRDEAETIRLYKLGEKEGRWSVGRHHVPNAALEITPQIVAFSKGYGDLVPTTIMPKKWIKKYINSLAK